MATLIAGLKHWRDRPALGLRAAYGVRWWSYRQLHDAALGWAATLADAGIEKGHYVLLWAPNSPEWMAALLGALWSGVIVVPVDADMSAELAARLADRVGAKAVLHGPDQAAASLPLPALSLFDDIVTGTAVTPNVTIARDDPALILFTSGATQSPKGVIITHGNLLAQIGTFRRWRLLTRLWPFRLLALSPLSHVQGLMLGAFIPLSLGMSVLYSTAVDPESVIRIIRGHGMHVLLAVPGVQHRLVAALRRRPFAPGRESIAERVRDVHFFPLRRHLMFLATHRHLGRSFYVLLVGGAVLPPDDERFWYDAGFVLVQGYGLTETTALATVQINNPFGSRLGAIGRPLANQHLTLSPEGEILVSGPTVSPGYFDEGGLTPTNGLLPTGDLAQIDAGDRLIFKGRKSNVIVTGEGLNVVPGDVEAVLRAQPDVRDAVVLGLEKGSLTEVHAVLLPADGADAGAVVAAANGRLEPHQRIRSWSVWPEPDFPRTALLKVRRAEVATAVASPRTTGEAPASVTPTLPEIQAIGDRQERLRRLADYLSRGGIRMAAGPSPTLATDLGLGSLDVVELMALLEQRVGRRLPAPGGGPQLTVADLQTVVQGTAASPRRPLPTAQPGWSGAWPGRLLRHFTQPLLIGLWSRFVVRTVVHRRPSDWPQTPCFLAVAPHHHWLDGFVVYAALPAPWRRRLLTVTNRDFAEYFDPAPGTPTAVRRQVGWAYHFLWPLVFEFAIVPNYGSTRDGLDHVARFVERRYWPVTFPKGLIPPGEPNERHEPGMAALALQAGAAIIPVWLRGHDDLQLRPHGRRREVGVWLGDPLQTRPDESVEAVVARVEAALQALARQAAR